MRHATRLLPGLLLFLAPLLPIKADWAPASRSFAEVLHLVADDPVPIDWRALAALDLETGNAPAALKALDGKRVIIAAFIVPLEDDMQAADEFLLVPYFGACVHTPPPPPNQMVYVKMKDRKTVKIGWWDPVHFVGVLHLKEVESPYGASYFEMEGLESRPYKPATK
ncbi:MAG TPA: DUF3299 domain-containing protein [Gemmatimonadales bacterium]|nr:DUF3299 domain-containing protein [Gemmatimonadales bacterium]